MAVALALMLGAIPIVAGAQPAQTDTPSEAAVDAVVAQSDDVRALVAPVALYPDPILALVLQASTLPLQVVQAERFLDRRAKDSSLQPNPDWDKSIIGLLNYPRQVESMAEYIDWTEELGNAVVDNLDEVQASVQEIRLAAYYAGYLKSNKQQKVEVKDEVVRITSTDAQKVSIPQYDPAALLTALDEVEEAEDAADEAVAAPAVPASKAPATPAPQPSARRSACDTGGERVGAYGGNRPRHAGHLRPTGDGARHRLWGTGGQLLGRRRDFRGWRRRRRSARLGADGSLR
jgi:hypothetical protein